MPPPDQKTDGQSAPSSSTSVKKLAFGSYFRANALGEGSYGSVMVVYDDDGSEFAAKRFEEAEEGDLDAGVVREISLLRLLSQCPHPGIVPCFDISLIEEGGLSMIMPKYESDLFHMIENQKLTKTKDQLNVIWRSLEALDFLHARGVMHRDLKSDNIMVKSTSSDGGGTAGGDLHMTPVLIDFSLGKFFRDDPVFTNGGANSKEQNKTAKKKAQKAAKKAQKAAKKDGKSQEGAKHSTEMGTVTYIAPEVVRGDENYDERVDVWSFGVIALEILTKTVMQAQRDSEAFAHIREMKGKMKQETPLGKLLHGCLQEDMELRFHCRDALASIEDLAIKAKITPASGSSFSPSSSRSAGGEKTAAAGGSSTSSTSTATPQINTPTPTSTSTTTTRTPTSSITAPSATAQCSLDARNHCKAWTDIIEYGGKTKDQAEAYCGELEGRHGLKLSNWDCLYLVLLAAKVWEPEVVDIWELDEEWDPSFKKFDPDRFIEKELEFGKLLDWCLYLRRFGK
ncbi:unnamed protein product [Amoebophrya sp. A25]|nr:unnamed protein product [Amoebophrya sp. A25]|eukprot:GSA25T00017017001.1